MALSSTGLRTCPDPVIDACTGGVPGVRHDWRHHSYTEGRKTRSCYRCVWCHAIACGDWSEPDPCWEPYHHRGPHLSRGGVTWPLGGNRR